MASRVTCTPCVIPSTPVNVREDVSLRTLNTLGVAWDAGFDNGSLQSTYTVTTTYPDEFGVIQSSTSAGLIANSYDHTNLTPGRTYTVSIVAQNVCGMSLPTTNFAMTAGTCPSAPVSVVTRNIENDRVTCSWTAPSANGFPIQHYRVAILSAGNNNNNNNNNFGNNVNAVYVDVA